MGRVKPISLKTQPSLKASMCLFSVREAGLLILAKDARRLEATLAELRVRRHDWRHAGFYGSRRVEVKCASEHQGQAHIRRQKMKLVTL